MRLEWKLKKKSISPYPRIEIPHFKKSTFFASNENESPYLKFKLTREMILPLNMILHLFVYYNLYIITCIL